ncbi:hypothetical protein Rsub_03008 [Raphidocelis subcapitata]|uniref:Caleosin n=1 Tax=Raphidocelis subcapitata TaxID=307507 RepID=A0A2V0P0J4_9CHLO|nr:hypothetical protein Rsub_03008 [Raphidocelis subcapitata]|eukprot:GBF90707.1 hypothetical protein Rsub_03008 [Raphidocelis subcapitata]
MTTAPVAPPPHGDVVTSIPSAPVTEKRPVPRGLDKAIPEPGVPRANKAVSKERPDGSPPELARPDYTVMQQARGGGHVAFFDADGDGVIWPLDTYRGFRRIGFNPLFSLLAVPFIHGSFSYPTCSGWLPDPFFRIFIQYDKRNKGALDWNDINDMIQGNTNIVDPTGWSAARFEWWTLWLIAADEKGEVSKEKVRAQYDGSLWYLLADENERRAAARREALKSKWD